MKLLVLSLLVLASVSCSAQSFFKPLPKIAQLERTLDGTTYHGYAVEATDSVMNAFRPVANIASFGVGTPGGAELTGAGVSYQHLKWDVVNQKWTSIWSVNALAWYKAPLDPSVTNPNAFAYGVAAGFFNNLLLVGGAYDGKNIFATVGIGISLNN